MPAIIPAVEPADLPSFGQFTLKLAAAVGVPQLMSALTFSCRTSCRCSRSSWKARFCAVTDVAGNKAVISPRPRPKTIFRVDLSPIHRRRMQMIRIRIGIPSPSTSAMSPAGGSI